MSAMVILSFGSSTPKSAAKEDLVNNPTPVYDEPYDGVPVKFVVKVLGEKKSSISIRAMLVAEKSSPMGKIWQACIRGEDDPFWEKYNYYRNCTQRLGTDNTYPWQPIVFDFPALRNYYKEKRLNVNNDEFVSKLDEGRYFIVLIYSSGKFGNGVDRMAYLWIDNVDLSKESSNMIFFSFTVEDDSGFLSSRIKWSMSGTFFKDGEWSAGTKLENIPSQALSGVSLMGPKSESNNKDDSLEEDGFEEDSLEEDGLEDDELQNSNFPNSWIGFNWSDPAKKIMSWDKSERYCSKLGGRLPTRSEVKKLFVTGSSVEKRCYQTSTVTKGDWHDPAGSGCGRYMGNSYHVICIENGEDDF